MKFIVHNEAGAILRTGHCTDADLPLQAGPGEFVMEGDARDDEHMIVHGEVVEIPQELRPPAPSLDDIKRLARIAVDDKAESVRLRYITGGAGQAATYIEKAAQADVFAAALYLGNVPPMVQAEMDAAGLTKEQAAELIRGQRDAWLVKGADIERERRRGKINVDAAEDADGVDLALNAALAALDEQ